MRLATWYGIGVGVLMLAQWTFFLATGSVPELRTEPIRISFHLFGELVTALGLLTGGVALLRSRPWAKSLYLVSAGMALYSEIVSPGYFAQQGQWGFLAMFAVLVGLAILSVVAVARADRGTSAGKPHP